MERLWNRLAKRKRLLQAAASLLLLAALAALVEPRELLRGLKDAPLGLLLPWIAAYNLLSIFLWGNGIFALFRRAHGRGYLRIVAAGYKIQVLSAVVPGRLADLGSLFFWKGLHRPSRILAVLMVDKCVTLAVSLLLGALALARLFAWPLALPPLVLIVLGAGGLALALAPGADGCRRRARERLLGRWAGAVEGFRDELAQALGDRRGVLLNLLVTVLRVLLAGLSYRLILSWFGVEASLPDVILIQSLVQLACLVPIAFQGIGLVDAAGIALLGRLGAAPGKVLAAGLASTAAQLLFTLLLFAAWRAGSYLLSARDRGPVAEPAPRRLTGTAGLQS